MDVTDVQGGCEPSLAHKLVRQASGKLERCGATGQVMVHVAPDGRVEGVDADADAKPCLTGRMAQWRLKMREARHCTLHLRTESAQRQLQQAHEAGTAGHPVLASTPLSPVPPPSPRPGLTQPPAPAAPDLVPAVGVVPQPAAAPAEAAKPAKLTRAEKAKQRAEQIHAKKAALVAARAAKKAARADAIAAKKAGHGDAAQVKRSAAAEKRAARLASAKEAKAAMAAKAKAQREARAAKHKTAKAAAATRKAAKHGHKKPHHVD